MLLLKLRSMDRLIIAVSIKICTLRHHACLRSARHRVWFTLANVLLRLCRLEQIELLLVRCHRLSSARVPCIDSTTLSSNTTVCLLRHLLCLTWARNLIILKSQSRYIIRVWELTEIKNWLIWLSCWGGSLLARAACSVSSKRITLAIHLSVLSSRGLEKLGRWGLHDDAVDVARRVL